MYLFSTFNNNTNAILNDKKEYKKMVYTAEEELNLELDKIKNGNFKVDSIESYRIDNVNYIKRIGVVDKVRGVYVVKIDASSDERSVTVEGYERYAEEIDVPNT